MGERKTLSGETIAGASNVRERPKNDFFATQFESTYEKAYLDLAVEPEERKKADLAISTFYAIWDYIREVAGDLEHLEGDCRVVDAIYAVNEVRRLASTLKIGD